ncbi:MAG: DUF554 domain-containing protein [Fimbriimonadaceae bacterium]|nr:MAG: DUF554 domain-containing protein [Fimbriimonadaceae bacterium]
MHNSRFVGFGTILNTFAVLIGSAIGLATGSALPSSVRDVAVYGIGLIVIGIGIQMFLKTKNALIVIAAICIGGAIGAVIGLDSGIEALSEWARSTVGGDGDFNQGFITASVLFCIGPITLMGCLQDALERKTDLLNIKSMLDGVSSIFLAGAFGFGVLLSAFFVLIFQGILTMLARPLQKFARDEALMLEATATGGVLMMCTGLSIAQIRDFSTVLFLPALFVAPVIVRIAEHWQNHKKGELSTPESS